MSSTSRLQARSHAGIVVAVAALLLAACAGGRYESRPSSAGEGFGSGAEVAEVELPPEATEYTTSSGSNGVRGGESARDAERILKDELLERGDQAEPDAALAATASWLLHTAYAGQNNTSDAAAAALAAQRFGFAGAMLGTVTGALGSEQGRGSLREILSQIPKNTPINRYGISAGRGQDVSVVFGLVDASLEDFPRSLAAGGSVRLKGSVGSRFERASVFATDPDGKTNELAMKTRDVDATLAFPSTGVYKLEILGYGATGPVVLVNVPINVGVVASRPVAADERADPNLSVEQAETILFALLNEERTKRGLASLAPDAELRRVALGHSTDMTEHRFFGHVSPTTGSPEDRVRAAQVRISKYGECVALESGPARAHRALMDSPAHRSAMLTPDFTHVGIGVSFVTTNGQRRLNATLLLGRRPPPEDARLSAEDALAAIQAARKARDLPALRADPVLTAAARVGAAASGSGKGPEESLAAVGRELQRQVNRTHTNRASCQLYVEIIDREQLAEIPLLQRADVVSVGVGTAPLTGDAGPKLGVVVLGDAGPGKPIACN